MANVTYNYPSLSCGILCMALPRIQHDYQAAHIRFLQLNSANTIAQRRGESRSTNLCLTERFARRQRGGQNQSLD